MSNSYNNTDCGEVQQLSAISFTTKNGAIIAQKNSSVDYWGLARQLSSYLNCVISVQHKR